MRSYRTVLIVSLDVRLAAPGVKLINVQMLRPLRWMPGILLSPWAPNES